jgi:hypothetical protein
LEDTLKVFIELTGRAISDMKNATMENTQMIARIEGQMEYLVAEVTRIEEEELQNQLMAQGHYMIDEDDASHSDHEHVPAITILESEEIVDSIGGEGREELKLIHSSQSLLRHFMNSKLQFFNVSKSHLVPKASRIYAHNCANLGTIVLRRSFEESKLAT